MRFLLLMLGVVPVMLTSGFADDQVSSKTWSLSEVIQVALERNLDVQLQKVQVDRQRLNFDLTKAAYEPLVSGTIRFDSQDRAPNSTNEGPAGSTVTDDTQRNQLTFSKSEPWGFGWQAGVVAVGRDSSAVNSFGEFYTANWWLGAEQKLLKGFSFDPEIRRRDEMVAKGNLAMSRLDFSNQIQQVIFDAEQAYWELINAREQLNTAKNSLELAHQLYQQNKTKVDIGTLAPIELVFAESTVASRESDVVAAENYVRAKEDALKRMMNLPAELWQTTLIPTDSPELKEPRIDSLDDAFRQALENRMDYLKQSLSEKNLQIDVKYFHNQLKPDLTFKATYTSAGSSYPFDDFGQPAASSVDDALSNAFSIQFPGLNLELALSWTPFQQANKINRSKADVALREHALQTQKLIVQIREEVRDALRALDAARKSLAAFQKSRRYQEQSLQAEIQKFQNGLTTNYQVSEAQDSLTRAVSSEIQSRIELRKQWARLKKAMGVLNEEHGILLE